MIRLKRLRSVLNNGARFIYNIHDRNEDLLPFYKKSHILPIEQRIFFIKCVYYRTKWYMEVQQLTFKN